MHLRVESKPETTTGVTHGAVAARRLLVAARKLFSHRRRTVTMKEREAVGGTERKEESCLSFFEFCRRV